jgi:TonB family protein
LEGAVKLFLLGASGAKKRIRLLALCLAALPLCVVSVSSGADETAPLKLPAVKKMASRVAFYPTQAKRLNQQGRALVEFSISQQGRTTNVLVSSAEPPGVFDSTVMEFVRELQFDVPGDWVASGGPQHKYHVSFVFLFRPCRNAAPCEEIAPFPADNTIRITTAPLPAPSGH